jgi:hypothetical protein
MVKYKNTLKNHSFNSALYFSYSDKKSAPFWNKVTQDGISSEKCALDVKLSRNDVKYKNTLKNHSFNSALYFSYSDK